MPFKRPVGQPTSNQIPPTFIRLFEDNKKHRLVIPSAQGSDCGRFTIQAMNAAGIKSSNCVLLVAPAPTPPGTAGSGPISMASSPGPPQTPIGPSIPYFLKELKHQPLRVGALAVLEARVVGLPTPQVIWLKNGKLLDNYRFFHISFLIKSFRIKTEHDTQTGICMLTIPQMFNEDLGEYTCEASNNIGTTTSSSHIMPKEQYTKWFSEEQQHLTHERKQKLISKNQRAQPTTQRRIVTTLEKQQNTEQLKQKKLKVVSSESSQKLFDVLSDSEDEIEQEILMPPLFRSELRGLRLTEGTDAILQCDIIWLKNNVPLTFSPRIHAQYSGTLAILRISMMTPEDSGEYCVIVENSVGKAQNLARIEVYPLNNTPVHPIQRFTITENKFKEHEATNKPEKSVYQRNNNILEEQKNQKQIFIQPQQEQQTEQQRGFPHQSKNMAVFQKLPNRESQIEQKHFPNFLHVNRQSNAMNPLVHSEQARQVAEEHRKKIFYNRSTNLSQEIEQRQQIKQYISHISQQQQPVYYMKPEKKNEFNQQTILSQPQATLKFNPNFYHSISNDYFPTYINPSNPKSQSYDNFDYFSGDFDVNNSNNYIHPYKKQPEQIEYILRNMSSIPQVKRSNSFL